MIKYFIRQYWRYIAMGLAFATISFLLGSCNVNAEGNYISSLNFTFKNYPDNEIYTRTNCENDICYWEFDNRSRGGIFRNYNATHSFTGVNLVMFNGSIVSEEGNTAIASINFLTNPCYYTQSISYSNDSYSEGTQNHSFSAFCPISNTDNIGSLTINPNQDLIEINMTNGIYVDKYMLSKIKIVQDSWGNELLRILYQNNGYWATNEGIQLQIKAILEQNLSKQDITNGYLNTFQGYFQQYNSKLDEIIANNQVCNIYDKNKIKDNNKRLFTNGELVEATNYGVTDFIQISKKANIKMLTNASSGSSGLIRICFYTINKTNISCLVASNITENQNITIPTNASYVKFVINITENKPQWEICDTSQNIINQQNEEIINSQKETNDTLKDSSVDDPDSDLEDMQEHEISNSVISDLLLLPINMFENIIDAIGGTCSSFSLGALFGTTLVLPCIDIPSLIGSNLWNVIDILFCGIFVLSIRKKFVDIFENITSLKDRGNELE